MNKLSIEEKDEKIKISWETLFYGLRQIYPDKKSWEIGYLMLKCKDLVNHKEKTRSKK